MPKMMNFPIGSRAEKKNFAVTSFAGIDLSSAPADIDKRRSPDAPNMMPDSLGNPIKRNGYETIGSYGGRINGSFSFGGKRIIHAGECLFLNGEKIWEGMADEISSGAAIGERLVIFDGFEALVFDGNDVHPLSAEAYIPTVLISKNADEAEKKIFFSGDGMSTEFSFEHEPKEVKSAEIDGVSTDFTFLDNKIIFSAAPKENAKIEVTAVFVQEPGGSLLEDFNLISRRWKESFLCDTGTEKSFTLSKQNLSKGAVRVWVMDEKGEMQEKEENIDFTADREKGKILFNEPVLKAPITGTDNVIIEAEKYFEGYENRINHCRKCIAFDFGGGFSRLFAAGNREEPQKDFWCAAGDPTYWPDTYYSDLASGDSSIIGYSILGNYLGTHISPAPEGRSVVLREPKLDENGNVSFPIAGHLQGEEALGQDSFVFMEKEALFLTAKGVYALASADVSGEKYTQNRSFYINKALCAEPELEKAFCGKWKQFYVIALNKKLYLLDSSQKSYQRGEPLSSFQYECYLWKDIDARIIWEEEGELFFGDNSGNVSKFTEGKYSDNGKAIDAYWTFPDFSGESFWKNKTVKTAAIEAAAFPQNEIRLEVMEKGFWKVLREWRGKISFFSWESLNWANFTWSGNTKPRTLTLKTKIKKFDKVNFRIVCDKADMAFGLYGFSIEFTEGGRFKK
ncbi:MAG: hypothetical protein IJ945_04005 [Oscillospiraceae bacterium]|nr:hypothetical protein [Oscillospiraceae bacterium]